MVQALGSIEDERTFSNLNFLKTNCATNMDLVVKMYSLNIFDNFFYQTTIVH